MEHLLDAVRWLSGQVWSWYAAFWYAVDRLLPSTVQPIEIVWVVPHLVGFLFYCRWYAIAWRQRASERAEGINGARGLVLAGRCARFLCLTFAFECWLGVGIIAMTQRPYPYAGTEPTLAGAVSMLLFLAGPCALILKGFWVERTERALRRLLEARLDATESFP